MAQHDELLSVNQMLQRIGVSRATIDKIIVAGELPVVRIAGRVYGTVTDCDAYVAAHPDKNKPGPRRAMTQAEAIAQIRDGGDNQTPGQVSHTVVLAAFARKGMPPGSG